MNPACGRPLPLLGMIRASRGHARARLARHDGVATDNRLRAVALVGIDGSGKTTQAHRLTAALTARGVAAAYWQNAGGRRWFGRLAQRLGRPNAQRLLGCTGLLLLESVLRWLAIARALVRSALGGRVAVMDRYAVCQYASIRTHGGRRWERLARAAYSVFPPPDLTFLLDVDPIRAYRRIEARGTDQESLEFLATAAAAYRSLPEFGTFVVVDANGTPDEVARIIDERLRAYASEPIGRPRRRRRPRFPLCVSLAAAVGGSALADSFGKLAQALP